ncbi:HORMA domain-containing protein [Pseudomassariella vexata]|uniref:HORMA domain-containing protein n=1 Tax=Pseudomassariella vexata TaxID=1141098 RepID=A0A1Y2DG45_9PEZI|nr:HORMA domain-containing protein [Pseudomassariella vexata]ORY58177.1 HORMA domain-containing protein [Pseudomassariella vexata]
MPAPSQPQPPLIPFSQASQLLDSFSQFLTVAIHNILFYRSLYPSQTFLTTRAYNLPVHQSRHPQVCSWIRDAVDAVKGQLVLGAVDRIATVIVDAESRAMERWMIDVGGFPAWKGLKEGKAKGLARRDEDDGREGAEVGGDKVNWTNVDEQFRAGIRRMAYAAEKMASLPEGCSFTIAVELRDEGEAPIGHPQHWMPSEPNLQIQSKDHGEAGKDVGGAKTTPLRAIEAGPLFFECWVEEGKAKLEATSSISSNNDV